MANAIVANYDCFHKFEEMKLKWSKYIIFKVNDKESEIIVEKISTSSKYEDFLADLPRNKCRWALYDHEFKDDKGGQRNKIVFYQWSPDYATMKDKMMTASSREALRRGFYGVNVEIKGSDYSEVEYDAVSERVTLLGD